MAEDRFAGQDRMVMVVDDTPENLHLLVSILSGHGYTVLPTTDSQSALRNAMATPPDIILLDIRMPGLDGFEVCRQLKASPATAGVPVIFISALGDVADKVAGFRAGGVDYLTKPFEAEEVLARVRTHIELRCLQKNLQAEIDLRRQAEDELRQINTTLDLANASKDKLFAIIAHDLRNPFMTLMGLLEFMLESADEMEGAKLRENLVMLATATRRAHELMDNLFTWSEQQRDAIRFVPAVVGLREACTDSAATVAATAARKDIRFVFGVSPTLAARVDRNALDTVLRNLLSNAVKFSERGREITVTAGAKTGRVWLAVADQGIGMDASTRKRLFRIDLLQSRKGTDGEQGSGLGLILCRDFIEKSGGRLEVESEEGAGTRITIELPEG